MTDSTLFIQLNHKKEVTMKKSLFIASLIAAFALVACNKPAESPAPEPTDNAPADSDNMGAAPDANQAAPAEPAEMPEAPAPDTEKSEETENK